MSQTRLASSLMPRGKLKAGGGLNKESSTGTYQASAETIFAGV
jgi:hypothetical protein